MSDAARAWIDLSPPWRAAFDEAWMSWRQGSLGVGAAITDGNDHIVSRGHNQFFHSGPGPISSTHMAHAEMNALAQLPMNRGDSATSAVVCDVLAELAAGDDAATTDIVLAKLWKDLVRIGS